MSQIKEIISKRLGIVGLAPEHIEKLIDLAEITEVKANQIVFHEGDKASKLYLILDGKVALNTFLSGQSKVGKKTIETLGKDEWLGWSWLFSPYRWHFEAATLEDSTMLIFNGDELRKYMDDHPDFGYPILKHLSQMIIQRLQHTRLQILDVYGH